MAFRNIPHAISAKTSTNVQGNYAMFIHSPNTVLAESFYAVSNLFLVDIEI